MSRERFPFRFGSYACQVIIDGREMRPVSSLTSSVSQQVLVEQLSQYGYSPTEVVVDFNVLALDTGRNLVLVDAGWGCCNPKMQGRLVNTLQEAGFKPDDFDLIVLTHGDRDHLGGLVNAEGNAVFPYASYLMSQAAWDWISAETTLARLPVEFVDFYRKVLPLIQEHLRLVSGETEFLPGLSLLPAPGHRPGHSAVRLTLGGKHLLHLADTASHPMLMLHPDWRWPFDSEAEQAAETRKRLLGWACENQAMLFGSHLPYPGLGTVKSHAGGWLWEPVEL